MRCDPQDVRGTTFIELAIDFVYATRHPLLRPGEATEGNISEQAKHLRASVRRMIAITKTDASLIPFRARVNTLSAFKWPSMPGIACRVQLLFPKQVEGVLIRAYLCQDAATVQSTRVAYDWTPDYGHFMQPMWRPAGPDNVRRRYSYKRPRDSVTEAMPAVNNIAARRQIRVIPAANVGSTAAEKRQLAGLSGKYRYMAKCKITHNRTALASKKHVIEFTGGDPQLGLYCSNGGCAAVATSAMFSQFATMACNGGVSHTRKQRTTDINHAKEHAVGNLSLAELLEADRRKVLATFVKPKTRDQMRLLCALHAKVCTEACLHMVAYLKPVANSSEQLVHKDELYCRVCHVPGTAPTIFHEHCKPRLLAAHKAGKRAMLDPTQLVADMAADRITTSRFPGVAWHKGDKRWRAQVKGVYLGMHKTPEEAYEAVRRQLKKLGLPAPPAKDVSELESKRSSNTPGVHFSKQAGRWIGAMRLGPKNWKYIGTYDTEALAAAAVRTAEAMRDAPGTLYQ